MQAWLSALASLLLSGEDDQAQMQRYLAVLATGDATGFLQACKLLGEAADPVELVDAIGTLADDDALALVGALVMHAFAAVRMDYRSRQDASAARAVLAAKAQAAYQQIGTSFGYEVLDWTVRLIGAAVVELSAIAARRAPIVRVETGQSLPSALLAFDLYGDPSRGQEVADRNRSGTSMIMPVRFEALAE